MKKFLVILLMGAFVFAMSGCSADEMSEDYEPEYGFNDEDTSLTDPDPVVEDAKEQGGDVVEDNDAPELENRKIIYEADLEMAVLNPTEVYNDVLDTIDSYTAYIEEADITSNHYEVVIRVLSSEFDAFVEDVKTNGELVSYQKTSEDITNSYSTFEARKDALETRHTRILELIAVAEDLDTILILEEERYEIEAELNLIGAKLANYDSLVDYSTVTLEIREVKEEIIVVPRTTAPSVSFTELNKESIVLEIYNHSDNNATIHVDVYLNGEFVTEYEENTFADSKTIITFDDLKSGKEYTFKVTSIADDHRVSLEDTYRRATEARYVNKTGNVFTESFSMLILVFEFIGLFIAGLLPFAFTGLVIYLPIRYFNKKKKSKKEQNVIIDIDKE